MSAAQGRVLHTGQAIVDLVMEVDALPSRGGDVYADRFSLTAGGGFNVMAAAARDRAEVVYLGAIGGGPFGQIVRDALTREGIAAPAAPVADTDTGFSVAIVDQGAERTFVSALGAEGQVGPEHLGIVTVRNEDIVYVTGYSLGHEVNRAALLGWLPQLPARSRVVFDASPLITKIPDSAWTMICARASIWTLNAREAQLALIRLGNQTAADDDVSKLAEALAELVPATVLVRDGARGTYLAQAGAASRHVPAHPARAVDTNGAGDAHTGVLMAELARGADLPLAIQRANVAAAIAVTRRGPATGPTREEIDRELQRAEQRS
jgi:sugar/nucleoside kinase (ribokinase family)